MLNEIHWEGSGKYKFKQGLYDRGDMMHPYWEEE
jgi:hypothetical protein